MDTVKQKNQMYMMFDAVEENVGIARITAAMFAGQLDFTLAQIDEIKVAVSEAVSNVVIHAYPNQIGSVELSMKLCEDRVIYEVCDCGIGIADVEKARKAEFSTREERMGLGFAFMKSFMDILTVESTLQQGTCVRMVKLCAERALQ